MVDSEDQTLDDLHRTLIRYFTEHEDATLDYREEAERDRDYRDNMQWTSDEVLELEKRGQAPIYYNRIKTKVDALLGMERSMRTDPKALPRTPQHDQAAEAATEAIRFVCDNNDFDQVRSDVFENLLIEGIGCAEVTIKPVYKQGEVQISSEGTDRSQELKEIRINITHIPWDRFFWDCHARRRDLRDARYKGQVIWMDLDRARMIYPDMADKLESHAAEAAKSNSQTYDDRPQNRWVDPKRRRVRIVEIWYKDGQDIKRCVFTQAGILSGPIPTPYHDEEGNPEDPYEFIWAYMDRDGDPYGAVRQLIPIQDEINKRRSKALHILSTRQVRAEEGAVEDVTKAQNQLAKPDGWVETRPGFEFEILPTGDMGMAQFRLLEDAQSEIDAVGANAALAGKANAGASGRALLSRQQQGQVELALTFDALRSWQRRVYKKVLSRIKQNWTEEKVIRVTDDQDAPKFLVLNKQVTFGEKLMQDEGGIPAHLQNDPRLNIPVSTENSVAEIDVDIIVTEGPDVANVQQEVFDSLISMVKAFGQDTPRELVISMFEIAPGIPHRIKQRVLREMRGGNPEEQQQRVQEQQKAKQLEEANAMAKIKAQEARAIKDQAQAAKFASEARGQSLHEIDAQLAQTELNRAQANKLNAEAGAVHPSMLADVLSKLDKSTNPG